MSDFNQEKNRLVWFDIPVANLDRASAFYSAVLGIGVSKEQFDNFTFCVFAHGDGNGGCLIEKAADVTEKGILCYFNVDKRIKAAVDAVEKNGGRIVEGVHSLGPHGFRAIVIDSEGNRIALHSMTDS